MVIAGYHSGTACKKRDRQYHSQRRVNDVCLVQRTGAAEGIFASCIGTSCVALTAVLLAAAVAAALALLAWRHNCAAAAVVSIR